MPFQSKKTVRVTLTLDFTWRAFLGRREVWVFYCDDWALVFTSYTYINVLSLVIMVFKKFLLLFVVSRSSLQNWNLRCFWYPIIDHGTNFFVTRYICSFSVKISWHELNEMLHSSTIFRIVRRRFESTRSFTWAT